MSSTNQASKPFAIRAYLPGNTKERKAILAKLTKAAKLQKRSVSEYVLWSAVAQADRELGTK